MCQHLSETIKIVRATYLLLPLKISETKTASLCKEKEHDRERERERERERNIVGQLSCQQDLCIW